MSERSIEGFRAAAAAWLKRHKRYDEDTLSEMVLHALERPEKDCISLELAYYNAYARLEGRFSVGGGVRSYRSHHTVSLDGGNPDSDDGSWEQPAPEPRGVVEPLVRGELRAQVLLREIWGLSCQEIADLFGCSEALISHRLGKGKAAVMAGGVPPDRDLRFEGLEWDVDWLTL